MNKPEEGISIFWLTAIVTLWNLGLMLAGWALTKHPEDYGNWFMAGFQMLAPIYLIALFSTPPGSGGGLSE